MAEEKIKKAHNIIMESRENLTLSGVTEVESFDDRCIALYTTLGELVIKGRELHIGSVSVETGDMKINGEIWSLTYGDKDKQAPSTFLRKLFR